MGFDFGQLTDSFGSFISDPLGIDAAKNAAQQQQGAQQTALAQQEALSQQGNTQIGNASASALGAIQGYGNQGAASYGAGIANLQGLQSSLGQPLGQGYQQSPGYQFQLQQGQQALAAQQSAAGGRDSGAAQKALLGYSQGLASQDYQQFVGNQLAQRGQQINTAGQLGQLYAGQGQLYGGLGQESAGIYGQQMQAQLGQNALLGQAYSNYAGFGGTGQQLVANQNAAGSSAIGGFFGNFLGHGSSPIQGGAQSTGQ